MTTASQVTASVKWVALLKVISQVASFLVVMIALQYLTAAEFGLATMAFIVMGLADSVVDFGFAAALMQRKALSRTTISSCFWLLAVAALVLAVILYFLSPWIADAFGEPRLSGPLQLLLITFLVLPVHVVFKGLLSRDLKLEELSKLELWGVFARLIAACVLAASGWGVWSLIAAYCLEKYLVAVLLVWQRRSIPAPCFDVRSVVDLARFGGGITLSRIVYFLLYRVDTFVVGRFFGTEALGLYALALQFVNTVVQLIQNVGNRVVFPLLSRQQVDREQFNKSLSQSNALICLCAFHLLLGMAAVAPMAIEVLLSVEWQPAGPLVTILAVAGCFQLACFVLPQAINAIGEPGVNVKLNTLLLLIFAVGYGTAAPYLTLEQLTFFAVGLSALRFALTTAIATRRLQCAFLPLYKSPLNSAATALLMASLCYMLTISLSLPAWLLLPITVAIGLGVFLITQYLVDRKQLSVLLLPMFGRAVF